MFEIDHSAARGKMAVRELIVFKHSKELGDCPAYKLFEAVEVKKNEGPASISCSGYVPGGNAFNTHK